MAPKRRAKALCCRMSNFLVAEEHDAMLVQRVADFGDRTVVELLRHVDPEDSRARRTSISLFLMRQR